MKQVLIIDDDKELCALMKKCIEQENLSAVTAYSGIEGLQIIKENQNNNGFSLIILDVMMPYMDGFQVLKKIREVSNIPVLMLTAKSNEEDKVLGLRLGADDYLTKPFHLAELNARIKSLIRRRQAQGDMSVTVGNLLLYPDKRQAEVGGAPLQLNRKEFDLLYYFARHPGEVFSRLALLEQVWGYQHEGYEHTVNTHINRLRSKIERDPAEPDIILTVWGKGYKFAPVTQEAAP